MKFKLLYFCFTFFFIFSCKENKIENECQQDFKKIFEQFGSNSEFQKKHIKFPLSFSFLNDNYDKTIDSIINEKDFHFINFSNDKNAMKNEYDKFKTQTEKIGDDKIIYRRKGYDNGILILYEFKKTDDCWNLIKVSDEST